MKVLKFSITSFALALLIPPTLMAGPLKRYIWNDSIGFIAAETAHCQAKTEEQVSLYVAQKPGASLNSSSKLKALTFFKGLIPGNLLDRSILAAKEIPADPKPATVRVISVPKNVTRHENLGNISVRGDEGTMAVESLQEIGNFVIEVIKGPETKEASPLPLNKSYWQAALEDEKYITLECGDAATPVQYVVFDVYDSKGIDPIAQVGISKTETRLLENVKVLTPDEANQEAIGEAPAPTPAPTPLPPTNPPTSPPGAGDGEDKGGSTTTPDGGEDEEIETPDTGVINPGLGYIVCTTEKTIPILDKDLNPIGTVDRFEDIIPNQSWDEKQKSSHLEVQFPNRKDVVSGWIPRAQVQVKADCAAYAAHKPPAKDKEEDSDYTNITLDPAVSRKDCCKFPTTIRPSESYAEGKLRFRASRAKGRRLHAGVDLYRKKHDTAVAVASGTIIRGFYYFYQGVFAISTIYCPLRRNPWQCS